MPTALITQTEVFDRAGPHIAILENAGFTVQFADDPRLPLGGLSDEETIERLSSVEAVIAWGESYSRRVLSALPRLRVVARAGVGYDRVDVAAATELGIVVTITPSANHEAVAEHALALMLAVAKRIVAGDAAIRAGQWPGQPTAALRGKTLGLIGLGRIGRDLAVRAAAFGMRLLAHETNPDREFIERHRVELVDLAALLARSDYLSLHCPLNDATRGLIDAAALARMKPDAVLINTARGGLVIEGDLIAALAAGRLGGCGLDVMACEPPARDNPLLAMPNVVLSPHNGGGDAQAIENMAVEAASNIALLRQGSWPATAVLNDPRMQQSWSWQPAAR